jgi:hypothetical protein
MLVLGLLKRLKRRMDVGGIAPGDGDQFECGGWIDKLETIDEVHPYIAYVQETQGADQPLSARRGCWSLREIAWRNEPGKPIECALGTFCENTITTSARLMGIGHLQSQHTEVMSSCMSKQTYMNTAR